MLRPAPPLARSELRHGPVLGTQGCSGRRRLSPANARKPKRHVGNHARTPKRCCRQQTPDLVLHNPITPARDQTTNPDPTPGPLPPSPWSLLPDPTPSHHLLPSPEPCPATKPAATLTTTHSWSFLHIPTELRLLIYHHALAYPPAHTLFRAFRRRSPSQKQHAIRLTTPALLLLCRQITAEALPVLQATPFVLDALPPFVFGNKLPLPVLEFIGLRTLQSMRGEIELRLPLGRGKHGSGWAWGPVVEEVLGVLRAGNRFRGLRLVVTLKGSGWLDEEVEEDEDSRERERREDEAEWAEVVGKEEECLERMGVLMHDLAMNNPHWWCPGKIEEEIWKVDGQTAVRRRYIRSELGYIRMDEPDDKPLEVAHYPEPSRVFGTASAVDFL
ncbi:hypothetical protein QBC39DRAFT_367193 [Podospora conica]|nr:hypothetical protein QBC39DRAFT_367193 [Schizothecium conicum]